MFEKKDEIKTTKFPNRVYTEDEIRLAQIMINKGYHHRLQIIGSKKFKEKALEAIKLVRIAGYYDFLKTYIRTLKEIDGLS